MKFICSSALIAAIVAPTSVASEVPTACASINIHPDTKCARDPIDTITFSTFTEAGLSGCYEDDNMVVAVSDQFCNLKTGNFHQMVYPKGIGCLDSNIPWYAKWIFPIDQTFAPDICIKGSGIGYSLNFCHTGPCPNSEDSSKDGSDSEFAFSELSSLSSSNDKNQKVEEMKFKTSLRGVDH